MSQPEPQIAPELVAALEIMTAGWIELADLRAKVAALNARMKGPRETLEAAGAKTIYTVRFVQYPATNIIEGVILSPRDDLAVRLLQHINDTPTLAMLLRIDVRPFEVLEKVDVARALLASPDSARTFTDRLSDARDAALPYCSTSASWIALDGFVIFFPVGREYLDFCQWVAETLPRTCERMEVTGGITEARFGITRGRTLQVPAGLGIHRYTPHSAKAIRERFTELLDKRVTAIRDDDERGAGAPLVEEIDELSAAIDSMK